MSAVRVVFVMLVVGVTVRADQAKRSSPAGPSGEPPSMSVAEAIEAVNSPRALLQEQGAIALYEWGPEARRAVPVVIKNLKKDGPNVRSKLLHVLIAIGPGAQPAATLMTEYLDEPNFHVRYLACRVLGNCGSAAGPAVPKLMKLASDPITSVRRRAVEALGNLGPEVAAQAVPTMVRAIEDPRHLVKVEGIVAAGKCGKAAAVAAPILKEIANNRKSSERAAALLAYWQLTGDADAVIPGLRDHMENADLPWEAAKALAVMGPAAKAAVPDLIKALDEEPSLQVFAAEALGRIGAEAKPAIPALRNLLSSDEESVRTLAKEVIAHIESAATEK